MYCFFDWAHVPDMSKAHFIASGLYTYVVFLYRGIYLLVGEEFGIPVVDEGHGFKGGGSGFGVGTDAGEFTVESMKSFRGESTGCANDEVGCFFCFGDEFFGVSFALVAGAGFNGAETCHAVELFFGKEFEVGSRSVVDEQRELVFNGKG